jgi:hypothetical protein
MADIETVGIRESIVKAIKEKTDKLTFDANGRLAIQNPPNLDVLLSTRASESTLSSFSGKFSSAVALSDSMSNPTTTIVGSAILGFDGTYWRRVRVDTSARLAIQNPPNLDVALSTRASEATLSAIKNALASVGTDKIRASVVDSLPESPFNLSKVAGTSLTGRDWSSDFAKLQNLDVTLSALRDFFRPIIKGSVFNQSVTANTNIFSSSLTPSLATATNPSYFRTFACFNASGVLSVVKTKGTTTVTMKLNGGGALSANCLYAFDIMVEYGESVNLQYSVNATALDLKVIEIASSVV